MPCDAPLIASEAFPLSPQPGCGKPKNRPMHKIIVTGANGQLGNELRDIDRSGAYTAVNGGYQFVFTDLAELDITSPEAVAAFVQAEKPQWIINAAAYTAVDRAETDPDKAQLLNATAVANLVHAAKVVNAGFVQVSTDYVFDGRMPAAGAAEGAERYALTESDPTGPRSVYGITKLKGEQIALAYPKSFVVRTAWLYSTYGNNFVKTMLRLGAERPELSVVADQWGTPTYAADLAQAIMVMVSATDTTAAVDPPKAQARFGLYHYTDEGIATWCDFAREIMLLGGAATAECTVRGITTAEYPTPAARPAWSVLSKEKIRRAFGVSVPDWRDSLRKCMERLNTAETKE